VVEEDLFASGIRTLVNNERYYFVAVAYAYNNFMKYDQNNPDSFEGQRAPYKAGRKGAGGPIKTYEVIPHRIEPEHGGTLIQGSFGDAPKVTRIEGHGNGRNVIDIDTLTHDAIMSGPPWKADRLSYEVGKAPISVKVVDPLNVVPDTYTVMFDSVNYFVGSTMNGKVIDGKWFVYNSRHDTVFSESWIDNNYDQLILDWGLAFNITQEEIPYRYGTINNGFLEATIEFEDPSKPWLWFVPDDDRAGPRNWIRAGISGGDYSGDRDAVYEKVLGGRWAPYQQTYIGTDGLSNSSARAAIDTKRQRLANVDLYFTTDRSKWTRSPVVETTDDEALALGNVEKFMLRDAQSIDQYGNPAEVGIGIDSFNMDAANYLSEIGLGWFPGYAIDVETGERLNIVYGESSFLTGDNGADMMWNPSPREGSKLYMANNRLSHEGVFFGGKHFIYIMGHNATKSRRDTYYYPAYDGGQSFLEKMADRRNRYKVRELFANAMWCSIPILDPRYYKEDDVKEDPYGFIKSDIKLRFRVVGQYCVDVLELARPDSLTQNLNKPMYEFNTQDIATLRDHTPTAKMALDIINIVPNPYYGYSAYERSQFDNYVKIINLPRTCTVSIYSLNGNLVKRFTKDADQTWLNWNIKNTYGIPVSSGVYIFHINAPGIGEKILKWFGVLRPQ
ncbi:MAG: T9SS type A sorting domain-containing protein, partial [candidate division Zixibacteria bacterium]|nr:T9SS type A sorting domain-containing protein [candidate division Zixibacteria bacterium]